MLTVGFFPKLQRIEILAHFCTIAVPFFCHFFSMKIWRGWENDQLNRKLAHQLAQPLLTASGVVPSWVKAVSWWNDNCEVKRPQNDIVVKPSAEDEDGRRLCH